MNNELKVLAEAAVAEAAHTQWIFNMLRATHEMALCNSQVLAWLVDQDLPATLEPITNQDSTRRYCLHVDFDTLNSTQQVEAVMHEFNDVLVFPENTAPSHASPAEHDADLSRFAVVSRAVDSAWSHHQVEENLVDAKQWKAVREEALSLIGVNAIDWVLAGANRDERFRRALSVDYNWLHASFTDRVATTTLPETYDALPASATTEQKALWVFAHPDWDDQEVVGLNQSWRIMLVRVKSANGNAHNHKWLGESPVTQS